MDSMPEIIEISSDEDEGAGVGLRVPEETKVQPGGKRKGKDGGGNDLRPGGSLDESDDDDCLILDGVPESVAVGTEYVELGGEMLDEMLIVGEKGQGYMTHQYFEGRKGIIKFGVVQWMTVKRGIVHAGKPIGDNNNNNNNIKPLSHYVGLPAGIIHTLAIYVLHSCSA
ncbi:pirin-like protein At1g50590 isoform X2 [Dendrobium catenatum]|uniref:pirin-like protein At1g50590 isoform X2 n=1 Tax=Dendrobium catenatum TaxID=906689 RepID=UPI00109FD67A|nr:pirin-like protein At1g50590 isoform X2 [Dendrobium catenatum]